MTHSVGTTKTSPDIFERLLNRGIGQTEYGQVKRIVVLNIPQASVFFEQRFGGHTIGQVLRRVDRSRQFLAKDFLLSTDQKNATERAILGAEICGWNALLERITPKIEPWFLNFEFVPVEGNECGEPNSLCPDIKISARHRQSGQLRQTRIPGDQLINPAHVRGAWTKAFSELGIWKLIWDLVCAQPGPRPLVSAGRSPQAWAMFTQQVIPELYEFMLPFYKEPGHYSQRIDKERPLRTARFPKQLFGDMRGLLQVEHPHVFSSVTTKQLMSVVQRHLERQTRNY